MSSCFFLSEKRPQRIAGMMQPGFDRPRWATENNGHFLLTQNLEIMKCEHLALQRRQAVERTMNGFDVHGQFPFAHHVGMSLCQRLDQLLVVNLAPHESRRLVMCY